jgi:catechol 2,3-dioxygenase-like lactoylglutathione lyase family enzyme
MFYTNTCSPVKRRSVSLDRRERGLGLDTGRHRPRPHSRARRECERRLLQVRSRAAPIWEGERGAQLANLVVTDDEPTTSGPVHIAFVADSRDQVDAFHRAGVEAGARDNGPPGVREQYSSDEGGRYYAAYLLDPDGNNVEAVCREFEQSG